MKIAVEGCAHGELETIYDTIKVLEEIEGIKVNLLICCGDFQSSRNTEDLKCMAVPAKYAKICTFHKYYSGEKVAPVLTIFIGGNHEASNYLQELPYGGWVAPNIYYLGYAGVVNIGGLRIAGLSGIYKSRDYLKGHYEIFPYDENTKRSVYHVRNLEVFRLKQLSGNIDIFLSHDWPSDMYKYGNLKQLLKRKPHFREDVDNNQLGSKPCEELLHHLKPNYWFAAHLHCKYAALVKHENDRTTKFLALDKCLPKRRFLQIVDIPHNKDLKLEISFDLEWLAILYATNHLLSVKSTTTFMPGPGGKERYNFNPSQEEKSHVLERFNDDLRVPNNFCRTAPSYGVNSPNLNKYPTSEPKLNPQTIFFCEKLSVDDPIRLVSENQNIKLSVSVDCSMASSFIEDSESDSNKNELTRSISPVKKISSMSLPEPKISDIHDANEDENVSVILPEVINKQTSVLIVENKKTVESPTPKKLKRRNVALYKTND